jgi:hypothetical protein
MATGDERQPENQSVEEKTNENQSVGEKTTEIPL